MVQKLIGTLNSRKQISLVRSALQPGFLDLTKDLNGNHVIQRCLQCLSGQDNEVCRFYSVFPFTMIFILILALITFKVDNYW